MTLERLIELLESCPVSGDTEVTVDTPDNTGYFEDTSDIYGICVYGDDNVSLKCWYKDKVNSND